MNTLMCIWPGKSKVYNFEVYKMDTYWNQLPGVYIFTKEASAGNWQAFYVGETGNFSSRLTIHHEDWDNAVVLGATHVHTCVVCGGENDRKKIQSDLIRNLDPPLNRSHAVDQHTVLSA